MTLTQFIDECQEEGIDIDAVEERQYVGNCGSDLVS